MKRVEFKIFFPVIWLVILLVVAVNAKAAVGSGGLENFNKGIAYLLIQDTTEANKYMKLYFDANPDPLLKSGFMLLISGNTEEATNRFRDFLNINHRSTYGVLGIAMSTSGMEVTNTMELLERAITQDKSFSAAYLCLGMEYLKRKNYPSAEVNFNRAYSIARLPEFKILLAELYLSIQKPAEVIRLLKNEADNDPQNFYYNFYTARAYYMLNQLQETGVYIEASVKIDPRNNEAQLLLAKYFIGVNDLRKARIILKAIKFPGFHKEYLKTYALVLTELKDRNAKNYLYESFSQEKWDIDINTMMARFYDGQKAKSNVQNWINRAILSGASIQNLQGMFPGKYTFNDYPAIPFFNISNIYWIGEDLFFVSGNQRSGEKEEIYIIDWETQKVISSLNIQGKFQDIFISPPREESNLNILLSSSSDNKQSLFLYAIKKSGRNFTIRPVFNEAQPMSGVHAAFNQDGSQVYFTNSKISTVAFESPFSIISELGDKRPVYPVYPFNVYLYDFTNGNLDKVSEPDHFRRVPVKAVRKYILLADAYQDNEEVKQLIKKGENLDLTSDEVVRTYFGADLNTVIIYLADLQRAFQAVIYDGTSNKITKIDETLFLGKDTYAAIKIFDFRPKEKKLVVMTADSDRQLITFNYNSYLFHVLGKKLIDFNSDPNDSVLYVLTERSKQMFYVETNLEVYCYNPYVRRRVESRKDLNKIISCSKLGDVFFNTNDGELLLMDADNNFHYMGPSFEGCVSALSPNETKRAAFINNRLLFITQQQKVKEKSNQQK